MNRKNVLKNRLIILIALISVLIFTLEMPVYAASNSNIIQLILNRRNKEENEEVANIEINSLEEELKVNKFSNEWITSITEEFKEDKNSDKITIRDIIKFICAINKTYKNVNIGTQTISSSKELAVLTSVNSSIDGVGPITITAAKLNDEEITLITLGGTQLKDAQATGIKEDLLSGVETVNDYLVNIMNLFEKTNEQGEPLIPEDKPIIVSGISLGGMVAQQLLAQEQLTSKYDFKAVICFGSPIISPKYRNESTRIVRFCDESDIVPFLGKTAILDKIKQEMIAADPSKVIEELDKKEKILEDGGYKTFIGAHVLSYVNNSCWDEYDVLGVKNGENTLTLEETMRFYDAPTLEN